jgi:hypothetical protein
MKAQYRKLGIFEYRRFSRFWRLRNAKTANLGQKVGFLMMESEKRGHQITAEIVQKKTHIILNRA